VQLQQELVAKDEEIRQLKEKLEAVLIGNPRAHVCIHA
jgi:hypothetical protein